MKRLRPIGFLSRDASDTPWRCVRRPRLPRSPRAPRAPRRATRGNPGGEDRVHVDLADVVELDRVGAKAGRDRRVHGIRGGEAPEQKGSASAATRAAILPDRADALDVLGAVAAPALRPGRDFLRFIGMCARSAWKPACISAAIERACARAAGAAGHSPAAGRTSARYSMIASESQITRSPCLSVGTLPAGECLRSSLWIRARTIGPGPRQRARPRPTPPGSRAATRTSSSCCR